MRAHPAGPRHAEVISGSGMPPRPASLNELDAQIWPRNAARGASGALELAGNDVRDLAAEYGSPLFVIDEADVRSRAREFVQAYSQFDRGAEVHYAAKAFLSTTVAGWLTDEGLGIDVASGGELAIALAGGVEPSRIMMHGNNKSVDELTAALDAGVGHIVIDSFVELARLAQLAGDRGIVQPVLIRVTVGVEAHTHEFIATAHEDQKFGFSIASGDAIEAVRRIVKLPALELVGVHSHIGSQIFDAAGFEVAAGRVIAFMHELDSAFGLPLEVMNLGGGMGIAYVPGDDPLDPATMAAQLRDIVGKRCAEAGIAPPKMAFEPGRAIIGPAGVTVYTVGTIKPVQLDGGVVRTFVSVDGGMSDNIRTALYDAAYTVTLASRTSDAEPMLVRVVGKHCESGDVVVRDAWLPSDLAEGDLLAVAATGAYCRSMASNYNAVLKPAVISVRDADAQVLLRRETMNDLLALDAGYSG